MKLYIVLGKSGEYSHHCEWLVKAFASRERAEAFELQCTKAAKAYAEEYAARQQKMKEVEDSLRGKVGNVYMTPEYEEANKAFHAWMNATQPVAVPEDPGFDPDGGDADYVTLEVEADLDA